MRSAGMPEGGALVRPTALHFTRAEHHTFVCLAHSTGYRKWLPPGLDWNDGVFPEGTLVISLVHYESFYVADDPETRIPYDELVIALPCRHEKTGAALYVPFIYLNEFRPIAYGRELFGYPKKLAEVSITRDGQRAEASVTSDLGYALARLSWSERAGATTLHELPPERWMLNRRRIPATASTEEEPLWAVDEITAHPVSIERVHSIAQLEVEEKSIQLAGGREDPLHEFGDITTLAATRIVMDWSIPWPSQTIEDFGSRGT